MPDTPDDLSARYPPMTPTALTTRTVQEPTPVSDPLINMKLGEYVVEALVASGGMGMVYRAHHPVIGRKVAIKVLRPSFASDPEAMSRFLKEARAIGAI